MHASAMAKDIKVQTVEALDNLIMLVTFSTGEKRIFDGTNLTAFPAFTSLQDPKVWKSAEVDHGVLTWKNGTIDVSSTKLYELSYEYQPLVG